MVEGSYDAEELHAALTTGLQHCLLWLYGLELPGLEKQEAWGGDYQVGSDAKEGRAMLAHCSWPAYPCSALTANTACTESSLLVQ